MKYTYGACQFVWCAFYLVKTAGFSLIDRDWLVGERLFQCTHRCADNFEPTLGLSKQQRSALSADLQAKWFAVWFCIAKEKFEVHFEGLCFPHLTIQPTGPCCHVVVWQQESQLYTTLCFPHLDGLHGVRLVWWSSSFFTKRTQFISVIFRPRKLPRGIWCSCFRSIIRLTYC